MANPGDIKLSANFALNTAQFIDGRMSVEAVANLDTDFEFIPDGFECFVRTGAERGWYGYTLVGDVWAARAGGSGTLEEVYTAGNTVGTTVLTMDSVNFVVGLGVGAAANNTGDFVVASGVNAAANNTGTEVVASGTNAAANNAGTNVVALGANAADGNVGTEVVALGFRSAKDNTGSNVVALGSSCADGNTLSNNFIIGNLELPAYANLADAQAAITIALGGSTGSTYLFCDLSDDTIKFVRL